MVVRQGERQEQQYIAAYDALRRDGFRQDPAWLREMRERAISRFAELGFPTARRGNEEWKYTDVGPIAAAPLRPVVASEPGTVTGEQLGSLVLGKGWPCLAFVDGSYAPGLSWTADLPEGVAAGTLRDARDGAARVIEQELGRHADSEGHSFTALNTAFLRDGALVYVPDGLRLERPLHILFVSSGAHAEAAFQPRVLVVLGKESSATVLETYAGAGEGRYLSNAVSEVVVGAGSRLEHYRLQRHGRAAYHVGTTEAVLGRDSSLSSVAFDLGGALVRSNLNVRLRGEGSSCTANGLYLVDGEGHADNQVVLEHSSPHTTSRELYKGVLNDRSRAVFHGSIIVQPGAQKVDAAQEDRNLLLSARAEADTKPAFWIYADDVQCRHGAASGRLDEEQLFYVKSRGVDERDARALLTSGFANEIVASVRNGRVRPPLETVVARRLEGLVGSR